MERANTTQQDRITLEYVALKDIQRWPTNPKRHDEKSLGDSFDRFGYTQPMLRDETTGKLVAGHGRLEKLQALKAQGGKPPGRIIAAPDGEWLVPVLRGIAFANEAEAEAYLLADNRISEIGGWDEAALSATLARVQATAKGFTGSGYNAADLTDVQARLKKLTETTGHGGRAIGPKPDEKLNTFLDGDVKQIVIYATMAQYQETLPDLENVMREHKLESHTDVFFLLLKFYKDHHVSTGSAQAAPVQPQRMEATQGQ